MVAESGCEFKKPLHKSMNAAKIYNKTVLNHSICAPNSVKIPLLFNGRIQKKSEFIIWQQTEGPTNGISGGLDVSIWKN